MPTSNPQEQGPETDKKLDPVKRYELFRDYLKHEDGLIGHRLAWSLTIQSFLLAGLAYIVKQDGQQDNSSSNLLEPLAIGIPVFGFLIALASTIGIFAAHRAIRHLVTAYRSLPDHPAGLPQLSDGGTDPGLPYGTIASIGPATLMCALWSCITVLQRCTDLKNAAGPVILYFVIGGVATSALLIAGLSYIDARRQRRRIKQLLRQLKGATHLAPDQERLRADIVKRLKLLLKDSDVSPVIAQRLLASADEFLYVPSQPGATPTTQPRSTEAADEGASDMGATLHLGK